MSEVVSTQVVEQTEEQTLDLTLEEKPTWWSRSVSWASRYQQFMWGVAVGAVAGSWVLIRRRT
jgi:hypothetical protein